MHSHELISLLLAAASGVVGYNPEPTNATDALAEQALANLTTYVASFSSETSCSIETAAKRREWGDLSVAERVAYTDAVNCLMTLPSKYNSTEIPGAKTRYDDFVIPHMNQTLIIHETANFLSWHRYFVWAYENALRDECSYAGYQPYWNWGKWASDPLGSPMYDGSVGSMGGNGVYEEHNCTEVGIICIPPGEGGGCVETGPFVNYTANLGPISPALEEPEVIAVDDMWTWNPRCMKRDVSVWVSSQWTTEQNSTDLITQNLDIASFQDTMQGTNSVGDMGVHGGGHFTMGGDPGGDFYISPGDPAFWLHHGQIDRTWWIWQNQDPANRTLQIAGTITMGNDPPSRNGTLQDLLDVGLNGPLMETTLAMSTVGTTGGPFCYIYV